MDYISEFERVRTALYSAGRPWPLTLALATAAIRRRVLSILLVGVASAAFGGALKVMLPDSYVSTEQLLFDPRGVKVFTDDLTVNNTDPNAAIAFVESEMAVLRSERVLSRVVDAGCAAASHLDGGEFAFVRYCPQRQQGADYAKALQALLRRIAIARSERSYVVDVVVTETTPELAARLAESVVTA